MSAAPGQHREPPSPDALQANCRRASRLAGFIGVVAGVLVLTGGWAAGIAGLRSVFSGHEATMPNTAVGFLLIGAVLWLEGWIGSRATRVFALFCAGAAGTIGVATMAEYVLGRDLHIDEILFRHPATVVASGRMAVTSAANFMLLGLALLLGRRRRSFAAGQYLVVAAGTISLFNLIGYIYGVRSFFGAMFRVDSTAMSIHSAMTFSVLCAGVLLSRPDRGIVAIATGRGPGSVMLRRLLPAALLVPVAMGCLRWQGQRMGFYDTAFGLALFTSANIVVFAFLIWRSGVILNRLDKDRARAESNLRESEETRKQNEIRCQTVLESLPHMVWTLRSDGSCDYLSPQWREYTGTPESAGTGEGWEQHVHPGDLAPMRALLRCSVREGTGCETELRIRGAAGGYRWFRAAAVPIRGADGSITEWFGSCTDIDAIKRTEAALRSTEASFRQLADAMPQMVWTATPDGIGNYYNRRCHDYLGVTSCQAMDSVWKSMLHPDDLRNCLDIRGEAFRTGRPYAIEYRFMRASDRTWRWHLGRGVPAFDSEGKIVRWIGTCVDIEEYKQALASIHSLNESLEDRVRQRTAALAQANQTLAQTRAKLQSVLDAATQLSIVATDTKGIIQIFNSGAEKMLRYRASEMEGIHTPEILHDKSECAERSLVLSNRFGRPVEGLDVFVEYARQGKSDEREWTYVRKDGTRLDVSLAVTPVCDHEGVLTGFLAIATDITAWKSMERELRLNIEKLAEQTRRAEKANIAKSEFLAAMSHEIRTPMNAILGMADMMWESQLNAEQIQCVEVFRRAGSNLLVLINDILDVSKIEAGHFELEHVEFDLEEVVDESLELMSFKARAKGLDLSSRLLPGVATALVGDPNRLRQILINILGNAVKFTESGWIRLTIGSHSSGRPGEIEFSISDTGIGIPQDKLAAIFDDFTQADTSTTRQYGGTGLGLGIGRRLVEMMNGRLTAVSSLGKGSTFRFNAVFDLAPHGARRALAPTEDFSGRRILVIDDNATNRLILRETVSAWGFESDAFRLPEEALAGLPGIMASSRPYSLVLLDNRMAQMDGFEAARRIKSVASNLPIVMLTSDPATGDAQRRRQAGLAGYAIKPVKRRELLRLVCHAIKSNTHHGPSLPRGACSEPAPTGRPLKILLVEDSPDNRLLVQVYMKGSPHRLTFADDGKAGVERFETGVFDLILMDMQMPLMDGVTATRAIRAMERERGATPIPIIALTANARPEDVRTSLLAGCDAHLSKPISKHKLLSAIGEHGRRGGPESNEYADEAQCAADLEPGVEPDLAQMVPGYLANRREDLREMPALLAASDFERLAVLGHNIKGSGGAYGFPEISRIGAALEHSAKRADAQGAGAQLAELEDYLSRI